MTNKELEKNFNATIEKLRVVKKSKIVEFSRTIEADLDEFVSRGNVTKDKCEDYFGNLKSALGEKEAEIDIQIKHETDRVINEYLIKLKEFLKYEVNKSNDVKLTDAVMERSLDYLESAIQKKALEPKPESEFSSRFDQMLNQTATKPVEQTVTITQEIEEPRTEELIKDLFDSKPAQVNPEPVNNQQNIDNAIDDLIAKVNIPEQEETVEEKVSTIDLEKLLEEVKSLV